MRKSTDYIIIHCADTYPDMDIGAAEIDRWHRARGWLKIGYHYVIRRDGLVETGRAMNEAGAHAVGYNDRSIGVCLVGGKSRETNGPESNFTEQQWKSLEEVIADLISKYPDARVIGHNEVSKKACPSFDVQNWVKVKQMLRGI